MNVAQFSAAMGEGERERERESGEGERGGIRAGEGVSEEAIEG